MLIHFSLLFSLSVSSFRPPSFCSCTQVHSENLRRRFIAPLCSVACFINFLVIAGAGILPLYISWASNCEYSLIYVNFWLILNSGFTTRM